MTAKSFFLVAGGIFSAVAVLHAVRLALGWDAIIGGWTVPPWISVAGLLIAGYMAYAGFSLYRRSQA